jgi:AcrR family transcriptional regulator
LESSIDAKTVRRSVFESQSEFGFTGAMSRGPYAKGVAKREEILTTALEVVSERGFGGASVKELADAVGLTPAGLLHYFGSKDELFLAVLRKRDEVDAARFLPDSGADRFDLAAAWVNVTRHNAEVPGLVALFSRMAAAADDPSSPPHEYFAARGVQLRQSMIDVLTRLQADGRVTDRIPPDVLARMIQGLADGLQLQWLVDPDFEMGAVVEALFELLQSQ